jgi:farnesyl diphosphate synthase
MTTNATNIHDDIKNYGAVVQAELEKTLSFSPAHPETGIAESKLWQAMRHATLAGGKRLRPYLHAKIADIFAVPSLYTLPCALAIELMHTYSLIHDDLPAMDNDDLRRGMPTVHVAFDEATAILAGDALQSLAFEILSTIHPDPKISLTLVNEIAKNIGAKGMVGGQMIDLNANMLSAEEKMIARLQSLKTGCLFQFCAYSACILGGASDDEKNILLNYSKNFGLIFQITDDLLDISGNEKLAGKKLGKDDAQGKITFLTLWGEEKTRQYLKKLHEETSDNLRPFMPSTATNRLIDLLDFIQRRQS